MDDIEKEKMRKDISDALYKALDTLLKDLAEIPNLVVEGTEEGDGTAETVEEITQWLFSRSNEDDHQNNITDKQ